MKMENVIGKAHQQPHQLDGVVRIVNAIGIGLSELGQIDGLARDALLKQTPADRHKVGLHASVGRRIRA